MSLFLFPLLCGNTSNRASIFRAHVKEMFSPQAGFELQAKQANKQHQQKQQNKKPYYIMNMRPNSWLQSFKDTKYASKKLNSENCVMKTSVWVGGVKVWLGKMAILWHAAPTLFQVFYCSFTD